MRSALFSDEPPVEKGPQGRSWSDDITYGIGHAALGGLCILTVRVLDGRFTWDLLPCVALVVLIMSPLAILATRALRMWRERKVPVK
ncbi:MAG: hypothetical protein ACAH95_13355 [Fimbriimonas sp.]